MRTRTILTGAALAASASLTALLAGCGAPQPPPTSAPAGAPPGGVTTVSQVFGPGCGRLPQGDAPGSLTAMAGQRMASALTTNPLVHEFAGTFGPAELFPVLDSQRAATVFVPSDEAMAAFRATLGEGSYGNLMRNSFNVATLADHVILKQRMDRDQLLQAGTVTALDGDKLTIARAGDTITVADQGGRPATVLCGNIPTANATVFIIDSVLVSPTSQFAHPTPLRQVHCAPNSNAIGDAVLCLTSSSGAAPPTQNPSGGRPGY